MTSVQCLLKQLGLKDGQLIAHVLLFIGGTHWILKGPGTIVLQIPITKGCARTRQPFHIRVVGLHLLEILRLHMWL